MKIKTAFTAIILTVLCLLAVLAATACAKDEFADEALAAGEVRVNVREGRAIVRWAASDADGYIVYRSASLYGDYVKAHDGLLRAPRFETADAPYDCFKVAAVRSGRETALGAPVSAFGAETLIAVPGDDTAAVQRHIDDRNSRLETGADGQFSNERFAMMFLPGGYDGIVAKAGYYTSVMGLGRLPADVQLGGLYVSDRVLSNDNSTCTFWRGVENVSIAADTAWKDKTVVRWAVSQATSMRRVSIEGDLALSTPSGWSSGGFLADSRVSGTVYSGTQQQWMSRNDSWAAWSGDSHNYVFSGCEGRTPASAWSERAGRYTNLARTEKMAEKPFLTYGGDGYAVFVPAVRRDSAGVSWAEGAEREKGELIPLDDFYVAHPKTDDAASLNAALAGGRHLLLTPGIYTLDAPLAVTRAGAVVLGMGYATLRISDKNTKCALKVGDVGGVRLADLLIDAGAFSENMLVVGDAGGTSHADDPIVLSNIYLRIGGAENRHTETDTAMVINADDTIGDNFWIWRADHSRGVAWDDEYADGEIVAYGNPVQTGLLVNGDNVSCYALMVEHCENYQTYWRGENGLTVMYQSETPYRVPSQDAYMSHGGAKNGYASYKVDDGVQTHRAFGLGIYLVQKGAPFNIACAIEVPRRAGVALTHMVTCSFSASGGSTIDHVVNETGGAVGSGASFRQLVAAYPA